MDRSSFEDIVKTENSARRFFIRLCWKNYRRYCIRCHSYEIYRLSGGRLRCHRCGYTFHEFSGRWLNELNISAVEWVWIIKLFEAELTAREITRWLDLSYPTVLKAVTIIRQAILARFPFTVKEENENGGRYQKSLTSRKSWKKAPISATGGPIFGLVEDKERIRIEILSELTVADILPVQDFRLFQWGSFVYTDAYQMYDSLFFCGKLIEKKNLPADEAQIEEVNGFWKFAKDRLMKFHGTCEEKFPLYLKEMEFRYNNRKKDIFYLTAQYLCDFVPEV